MYLQLSSRDYNYSLSFTACINLVAGKSATGKTKLVNLVKKAKYMSDAVTVNSQLFNASIDTLKSGSMLLIDLDDLTDCSVVDEIVRASRSDICVVFFGRKFANRIPVDAQNIFELVDIEGVTKNLPLVNEELKNYHHFKRNHS